MRTKSRPARDMNHVVDLEEHRNDTIIRTVLPRTEEGHVDKLDMFDKYVLGPTPSIPGSGNWAVD